MPAFKKVTATIAKTWQDEKMPCNHRMTRKEYAKCLEQNMARFDRAMDEKKG